MPEAPQSRIAFLKERVATAEAAHRPTFQVPFRQRQIDLVKIDVPIDFPMYNLRSGRTHRAQSQYIEAHDLPDDFFEDPESEEAQAAQDELLLGMIDQADLAEDLRAKAQLRPIVLTFDGFIIDGNRRTAALRQEGNIENLTAVVLPRDTTASEAFETELELQMARQTKAKYNWIDEALHVRWGVEVLEEPIEAIAGRMNYKAREVEELLGRLNLVDLYLDWLGAPGKYHRVSADRHSAAEQSFKDLYQRESAGAEKNIGELQRRLIRHACFVAIVEDYGYKDVRNIANFVRSQAPVVLGRLKDVLPEELGQRLDQPYEPEDETPTSPGEDLLEELAEAEGKEAPPAGVELLNIVDTPADAKVVAREIAAVAQDLADEQKERDSHSNAIRKAERALALLAEVEVNDQTSRPADVISTLDAIVKRAGELTEELGRLGS